MLNTCKIYQSTLKQTATLSTIPGDKSISHRLVILGSLAKGNLKVTNFLCSEDCLHTADIFRQMGVAIDIDLEKKEINIQGVGLHGLKKPDSRLNVGNSGTSIRLLSGVLSGQDFDSVIAGDESIAKRPMGRVVEPLSRMGAKIDGQYPPLLIQGGQTLKGITYTLPVASAQVKSAILLAGLYATGATTVIEPGSCRDHTERLMEFFGVDISKNGHAIKLNPPTELIAKETSFRVPSDISSSAFFLVLGGLLNKQWTLTHIGMNKTRYQIVEVLQQMGINIDVQNKNDWLEPYADLKISGRADLQSIFPQIDPDIIPFIIDEIPILAVAALFAKGTTRIPDIKELRVKESDRVAGIQRLAQAIGGDATVEATVENETLIISPIKEPKSFEIDCHHDHRIAMSAIVAALAAGVDAEVIGISSIYTSFPNFFKLLDHLKVEYELL